MTMNVVACAVLCLVTQSCLTPVCVWLFATPWTVAYQAPLSMGFSRQEYWSGLPCPLPGDLPNPGIKPRSPTLLADSLPSEPPGKPKNSGVGSLSLLQGSFLTQESNCIAVWSNLHCRRILNHLSYLGSPCSGLKNTNTLSYSSGHLKSQMYSMKLISRC